MQKKIWLPLIILCFIIILTFSYLIAYNHAKKNTRLSFSNTLSGVNLLSHKGENASRYNVKGYPKILFFGFTHCPEICPATLGKLQNLI